MDLTTAFPPFGLRIEAGPLVLRPVTDEVLPALIDVALRGVHDPAVMPFYFPWTDAPADQLPPQFAQHHWRTRASWSREAWTLEFAVVYEGTIVGSQGVGTRDYLVTRTGETGSWLGRRFQGRGIGTAMRQVICGFIFDYLDAAAITSAAFEDNPASLAVSRKVGYADNGTAVVSRLDKPATLRRVILEPGNLARYPHEPVTEGVPQFRESIGLSANGQ